MVRGTLYFLLWVGAILGVAAVVGKYFFFDIAIMGHNGMAPTLLRGEKILIYKKAELRVGRVMICDHPEGEGLVVGRIVAVSGQQVETDKDTLVVNNQVYKRNIRGMTDFYDADTDESNPLVWGEEYIGEKNPHWFFYNKNEPYEIDPLQVPQGYVYVLGDNRASEGQDSRSFDMVEASTCKGQVVMRITPMPGLYTSLAHGHFDIIE